MDHDLTGLSDRPGLRFTVPQIKDVLNFTLELFDCLFSESKRRFPSFNIANLLQVIATVLLKSFTFQGDGNPDVLNFTLELFDCLFSESKRRFPSFNITNLLQEVRLPAAGTKGAVKNPGELKDDTNSSREEKQLLMRALSNPPFAKYHVWWSLADSKYAGTALFVKKYFKPKKVSFSLDQIDTMSHRVLTSCRILIIASAAIREACDKWRLRCFG